MKTNRRRRAKPLPQGNTIIPFESGPDPRDAGKLIFRGPLSTPSRGIRLVRFKFEVELAGSIEETEAAMRNAWRTKVTTDRRVFGEMGFVKRAYSNSAQASFAVGSQYVTSYSVRNGVWGEIKLRRISASTSVITGALKYRAPKGIVATVRMLAPSFALAKWGNTLLADIRRELSAKTI